MPAAPRHDTAMHGPNRFKLGLFAANCSSGLAVTKVPERWDASWQNNLELARMADDAGIEFLLPIARWKGYGGETDFEGTTLETITWACGLLAHTSRITVFGTVHAALVHPVFAAKQFVTVDHIGQGRFGLNVVCGWNQDEFEMFGVDQRDHDERYVFGEEWLDVVRQIWTREDRFDYDGAYFHLKDVIGKPKPFGGTLPPVMNTGASVAGREFGARNCDFLFTKLVDLDKAQSDIAALRNVVNRHGTKAGVYTATHVVMGKTRKQAEEYLEHYAGADMADWAAVDRLIELQGLHTESLPPEGYRKFRGRFASGHGTFPIVGDADDVAETLRRVSEAGFSGCTVAFVDYVAELPAFVEEVLPRLERMGLRQPGDA